MEATNRARAGKMGCPICGGAGIHWDHTKVQYAGDVHENNFADWIKNYNGSICQTCGTIFQDPMPSKDYLREYYESGKYRIEHPSNEKYDEERADRILQLVERFNIEPKSCLDVGCGRGKLLKNLEIFFFARILGLEYDRGLPEIEEVVYKKEDVNDTYDLITCIHVMEHMREPVKEFEWMLSKLNPGGTLILEIPMYINADLSHLYVPSKKGLEMVMDKFGLEYLWLQDNNIAIIVIGDGYSKYNVQRVVYSYESPDFSTEKEYAEWLKQAKG